MMPQVMSSTGAMRRINFIHSYMTFDGSVEIGGLIKDQSLFLRVDAFNESGITTGDTIKVR